MRVNETLVETVVGQIFSKKWTPTTCISDVPVILLHDSLGAVDLWRRFPEKLATALERPVIAYDRLGYGKSQARKELPTFEFIEEEGTKYFPIIKSKLEVDEYFLFGHSVGGAMAINIAAEDAQCLGVITLAAQAYIEDLTTQGINEAKSLFQRPGQMERLIRWHGQKAQWVLSAWTEIWLHPDFQTWRLHKVTSVSCPVLAIHGDKDEYGSVAFAEYIVGNSAGVSKVRIIKGAGHVPHKTEQAKVLLETIQFIQASVT